MPTAVGRDLVAKLTSKGAQLIEVLPAEEYYQEHLPDAVNLPLKTISGETVNVLDRERPVIVYCWDGL